MCTYFTHTNRPWTDSRVSVRIEESNAKASASRVLVLIIRTIIYVLQYGIFIMEPCCVLSRVAFLQEHRFTWSRTTTGVFYGTSIPHVRHAFRMSVVRDYNRFSSISLHCSACSMLNTRTSWGSHLGPLIWDMACEAFGVVPQHRVFATSTK